jgi:hypothetical protein
LNSSLISDLGADSLDVPEICMILEEQFGIEILDREIDGIETVYDTIICVHNILINNKKHAFRIKWNHIGGVLDIIKTDHNRKRAIDKMLSRPLFVDYLKLLSLSHDTVCNVLSLSITKGWPELISTIPERRKNNLICVHLIILNGSCIEYFKLGKNSIAHRVFTEKNLDMSYEYHVDQCGVSSISLHVMVDEPQRSGLVSRVNHTFSFVKDEGVRLAIEFIRSYKSNSKHI